MEINSNKNDDQVDASLDLFVYRSKPNLKVHDNSISIEKINSSIHIVPNEALPNNLKWKNDIFSVSRLSNKKGVFKNQKSYLISRSHLILQMMRKKISKKGLTRKSTHLLQVPFQLLCQKLL